MTNIRLNFKQSFASLNGDLKPAEELVARCEAVDGYPPKMYWQALRERATDASAFDYLCLADDKLIGMINILFFADSVEITAAVDPEFRGQGIFKRLLAIGFHKLKQYIVKDYMLIYPAKAPELIAKAKARGGEKDHFEIEMLAPKTPAKLKLRHHLVFQQATPADVPILARLHEQCFLKPKAHEMEERFAVTILESHRKAYIARNDAGDIIGKLHLREDYHRMYIHDVGIAPEYQRQGYGQALMILWLKEHAHSFTKPVTVEVLGHNTAAIELYKSCGFEIIHHYEFWKFPFVY